MKLYLLAGERSGDSRGAELIRALRTRAPEIELCGAGGREMQALAGEAIHDWADEAVVGLWDVLRKYGYFRRQFNRMLSEIERLQPEAVIFIDYPGFNLRLAHALNQRRGETKTPRLIFYISPQVWAWHRSRIPKMAKYLDLMLCLFPFETDLYQASRLKAICIGHPLLDTLEERRTSTARESDLVGLFPGSREKEVRRIFPIMLQAAVRLRKERPSTRFEAAAASAALAEMMRKNLQEASIPADLCRIEVGTSRELMQRAAAGMVTSGTATLEAAFFGLPLVILYHVAWLTYFLGKRLIRVPFLGMPNILAGHEIAKEFLQEAAQPAAIATEVRRLLDDENARVQIAEDLAGVIAQLGQRGAAQRAADAVLAELAL